MQPSTADINSYEHGKWLYNIDGIQVEVFRWGWGDRQPWDQRDYVRGYHWSDEKEQFEHRLEADLRIEGL